MEVKINTNKYGDKEMMNDALYSQKQITEHYNEFANECAAPKLRDEFINILCEEHKIQAEIFDEMKKRGWYPTPNAEQEMITKAKEKYKL